jgi:hypothetical protein
MILCSAVVIYTYFTIVPSTLVYQLAFFTPGRFPASALTRNWYCAHISQLDVSRRVREAYTTHPEVAEDTAPLASHYTSVLDLGESRVAVHLRKLELGLGAHSLRQSGVADNVAEGLSGDCQSCAS